ncbi:hypothetical protein IMZ48_46725 [Candidatus Bathyarchaeota archaeon]|nr:hypothetical protein [Candidatus Bathyarchaeota archaeon]
MSDVSRVVGDVEDESSEENHGGAGRQLSSQPLEPINEEELEKGFQNLIQIMKKRKKKVLLGWRGMRSNNGQISDGGNETCKGETRLQRTAVFPAASWLGCCRHSLRWTSAGWRGRALIGGVAVKRSAGGIETGPEQMSFVLPCF